MEEKNLPSQTVKENEEIEIDLVELFYELKKKLWLIIGVTAVLTVAAAAYSFMTLKPSYKYSALINLQPNDNMRITTCQEILRNDIGKVELLTDIEQLRNSYILRLNFEGDDPEALKTAASEYLPQALAKVNDFLTGKAKADFERWQVNMIKGDLDNIALRLQESSFSAADANERLKYLLEQVEERVRNKIFLEAEALSSEGAEPEETLPNHKRNIGLAFAAGLFLSCGWVIARYVFRLCSKAH